MLIGYSRGPTDDQTVDLQRDAFERQRAGDTLVVWCPDRLGRSLKYLIDRAETRRNRGCDPGRVAPGRNAQGLAGPEPCYHRGRGTPPCFRICNAVSER